MIEASIESFDHFDNSYFEKIFSKAVKPIGEAQKRDNNFKIKILSIDDVPSKYRSEEYYTR